MAHIFIMCLRVFVSDSPGIFMLCVFLCMQYTSTCVFTLYISHTSMSLEGGTTASAFVPLFNWGAPVLVPVFLCARVVLIGHTRHVTARQLVCFWYLECWCSWFFFFFFVFVKTILMTEQIKLKEISVCWVCVCECVYNECLCTCSDSQQARPHSDSHSVN